MAGGVMRVVVVGAGLGGLSAACHLAGAGHEVAVVERQARPGGLARGLEIGGYRFDSGPTVLTMPQILAGTLRATGCEMADVLKLQAVDPMYRAHFADGSVIHVRHGAEAMTAEVRAVCGPREAAAFARFADWLLRLYRAEMGPFIDRNYGSALDVARPLSAVGRLLALGAFRRLGPKVRSFFRDERLVKLFSFQSLYAGMAPAEALALFSVITYMDTVSGVFYPEGGVSAIATALATAATKAGVAFSYNSPVERIELSGGATGGAVRAVLLASGERIVTDAVVCNVDLPTAYRELLAGLPPPRRARRGRYSPSAVVWHAGVRGALAEGTAHHNLFFGREWDDAFHALVHDGTRMHDPSVLVSIPTVSDPGLAPLGGHSLYVLEPVPNLDGRVRWDTERQRTRQDLAARLGHMGIPSEVEVESLVDPEDWAHEGLERGTPFGLAHSLGQSGPFRPANVDPRAPGLVFAGTNTVPGVGVPMVLISGRLAAERVGTMGRWRG
jgi:phytoene desaturase